MNIIFPQTADTQEKKLEWCAEELDRLCSDRSELWLKIDNFKKITIPELNGQIQTLKARLAEKIRKEDEIKYYFQSELGEDPIGFLITSHDSLFKKLKDLK